MIDWSNSDYTQSNSYLLFVPEVDEGVFLTSSYNVTEHHCYECKIEQEKEEKPDNKQSVEVIPVQEDTGGQEQSGESAEESMLVEKQNFKSRESFVPIENKGILDRFLMYFSNDSMILTFIIFLLFMIYIELRISNLRYKEI